MSYNFVQSTFKMLKSSSCQEVLEKACKLFTHLIATGQYETKGINTIICNIINKNKKVSLNVCTLFFI